MDKRRWNNSDLTPEAATRLCEEGADPDTDGYGGQAVETMSPGRNIWEVHQALQRWRLSQGRSSQAIEASSLFWTTQAKHGCALQAFEETGLKAVPALPPGRPGVLMAMMKELRSTAIVNGSTVTRPATVLNRLLGSTQKWQPWVNHERYPGVPEWFEALIILPRIFSLPKASRAQLTHQLLDRLDTIALGDRAGFLINYAPHALPRWENAAPVYPVAVAQDIYARQKVLEGTLSGLQEMRDRPGWGTAYETLVASPVWREALRGLRHRPLTPAGTPVVVLEWDMAWITAALDSLIAVKRTSTLDHYDRHVFQACPFPMTIGKAKPVFQPKLEHLRSVWRDVIPRRPDLVALLDSQERALLGHEPEFLALLREAELKGSTTPRPASRPRMRG